MDTENISNQLLERMEFILEKQTSKMKVLSDNGFDLLDIDFLKSQKVVFSILKDFFSIKNSLQKNKEEENEEVIDTENKDMLSIVKEIRGFQ